MTADDVTGPRAHFNHAGTSIPPPEVVDRVVDHLRLEAEIGGYEAAEAVSDEAADVAGAVAGLIGADPGDVVAVESATRAWEQIIWALALTRGWGSGDRIVVDGFAYASSWATLLRLRDATGLDIAVAPALGDGSVDPSAVGQVVDERTRLVLATHVPTHVGTVSDVAGVGAALAGHDLVYAVDISQSIGQLPVDVGAIGCDVAFAPGRKFLRAPRGTGVLFVAAGLAQGLEPLSIDLTAATSLTAGGYELVDGVGRFELFEHSVALRLGLGVAARHASEVGIDAIAAEVQARTDSVVELVNAAPGLELLAPPPLSGIVSVTHERLAPDEVRRQLTAAGINAWVASLGGSPLDQAERLDRPALRLSVHCSTTDGDLERLDRALRALT
jgi:cysteine desulfurase / selenocysteine lyase